MKVKRCVIIITVMVISLILHPSISAVAAAGETAIPGSGMLGDIEEESSEENIIIEELIVENNPRTGDSARIESLLLFLILSGGIFLRIRKNHRISDHCA